MSNKTLAMLAYVTIFGWLIAFLVKRQETDAFRRYHLKQGFGLFLTGLILNLGASMLMQVSSSFNFTGNLAGLSILILSVIGIITASRMQEKPLPIIGGLFENSFNFL